jgi:DMAP1-binding Domain
MAFRSNKILISEHACLPSAEQHDRFGLQVFPYTTSLPLQLFNFLRFHLANEVKRKKCFVLFLTHEVVVVLKGDITQKGYEKKRQRLLGPYLNITNGSQPTPAAAGKIQQLSRLVFDCGVFRRSLVKFLVENLI